MSDYERTETVDASADALFDYLSDAWFRVDRDERRIQWGSEGPNDYRGELEVIGEGDVSEVAVRLHTSVDHAGSIEGDLQRTLDNIKRLVEGSG